MINPVVTHKHPQVRNPYNKEIDRNSTGCFLASNKAELANVYLYYISHKAANYYEVKI